MTREEFLQAKRGTVFETNVPRVFIVKVPCDFTRCIYDAYIVSDISSYDGRASSEAISAVKRCRLFPTSARLYSWVITNDCEEVNVRGHFGFIEDCCRKTLLPLKECEAVGIKDLIKACTKEHLSEGECSVRLKIPIELAGSKDELKERLTSLHCELESLSFELLRIGGQKMYIVTPRLTTDNSCNFVSWILTEIMIATDGLCKSWDVRDKLPDLYIEIDMNNPDLWTSNEEKMQDMDVALRIITHLAFNADLMSNKAFKSQDTNGDTPNLNALRILSVPELYKNKNIRKKVSEEVKNFKAYSGPVRIYFAPNDIVRFIWQVHAPSLKASRLYNCVMWCDAQRNRFCKLYKPKTWLSNFLADL